jgi:hypothetical protein
MMDNLDTILQTRAEPIAPTNLAQRIIDAAEESNRPKGGWWDGLQHELSTWIFFPRPAYVMGAFLLFGLLLGFQVGGLVDVSSSNYDISSFLVIDEGDWS